MSELPPKPRLLMFLHGLTILLIGAGILGLVGYALLAIRPTRYGSAAFSPLELSVQVAYSTISTAFCFVTARAISRRSFTAIHFGAGTFFGMALFNLGFLIWWLIARGPLSGGILLFFVGFMIGKSILYFGAAAAFAFSSRIKNYFDPETVLLGVPPPPPEFTD